MRRFLLLLSLLFAAPSFARTYLCVVGDSISAQGLYIYTPTYETWPDYLAKGHLGEDWSYKNMAKSGDTTSLQLSSFTSDISGRGCTHVAFLIGTNDLTNTADSGATICGRITAMADIAHAQCAEYRADGSCRRTTSTLLLKLLPRGNDATFTAAMQRRWVDLNACLAAHSTSLVVATDTAMEDSNAATGTAWAPSTAYGAGDRVVNGGNLYECITSGTSAGSGGPSGTGTSVTDGSAEWVFMPRLRTPTTQLYGPDLHPDSAGEQLMADTVEAAAHAAGAW